MILTTLLAASLEGLKLAQVAAACGAAIAVIGGAKGIGKIGSSAMEAIGRQPEAAGNIRTSMLIAAALIEGIALFGVITCLLIGL